MANKETCGIYKITNTLTNETYIGQSKNIEKRIATHKEDLKIGEHVNKGLQEDYDLAKSLDPDYEIFNFEIIKEVKAKDLNKEEMYWINEFNSFERGYNKTIGGIHDETKGHVDYGGGRLFTDEKRIKLITKELTNDFDNKENYIFKTTSNEVLCFKCGKEFNDEFEFCPYCGTEKPKQKICPKCKIEPSIEFSFCPKCGTELVEKEKYSEEIERKKKEEMEKYIIKAKSLEKKGKELEELGNEYLRVLKFDEALDYYTQAKEKYSTINSDIYNIDFSLKRINENLIYTREKKIISEKYACEAIQLEKKAQSLEEIANGFFDMSDYEKALSYYYQAKAIYETIDSELYYIDHSIEKCEEQISIIKYALEN